MTKKFMPFWFADIIATEKKLSDLSVKGIHLSGFSPVKGVFTFEQGDSEKAVYRICRAKNCCGEPPGALLKKGWEKVCGAKNYYIVKSSGQNNDYAPSYKSWLTVNRIALWTVLIILCCIIGYIFGWGTAALDDKNFDIFKGPTFLVPLIIVVILSVILAFIIKANRKLNKTSKDLGLDGKLFKTIPKDNFIYDPKEEKQMIKDGRMMKKTLPGWFYDPEKASVMVEEMAEKGWKFYRFDEMGVTFFFEKSEPCKIKFAVDYQNEASDDYYAQCKEDGWKLEFTSVSRSMCFIIWTKVYETEEEKPEFYTDNESRLIYAKRMLISFGVPYVLLAAVCIFGLVPAFISLAVRERHFSLIWMIVLYLLMAAEFGFFSFKVIRFYIRTKKSSKSN